jgi:hypothetical protein
LKQAVGISSRLRRIINWTLWRGRPPLKRKKTRSNTQSTSRICGRISHSMSYSPPLLWKREREKVKRYHDYVGRTVINRTDCRLLGNHSRRAGLKKGADIAVGDWSPQKKLNCRKKKDTVHRCCKHSPRKEGKVTHC